MNNISSKTLLGVACLLILLALQAGRSIFFFVRDRGTAAYNEGHYEQAIAEYSKALDISRTPFLFRSGLIYQGISEVSRVYCKRGDVYFNTGQYPKAIADYTAAIAADPHRGYALYRRCLAYKLLGNMPMARKDAEELEAQGYTGYHPLE